MVRRVDNEKLREGGQYAQDLESLSTESIGISGPSANIETTVVAEGDTAGSELILDNLPQHDQYLLRFHIFDMSGGSGSENPRIRINGDSNANYDTDGTTGATYWKPTINGRVDSGVMMFPGDWDSTVNRIQVTDTLFGGRDLIHTSPPSPPLSEIRMYNATEKWRTVIYSLIGVDRVV